MQQNFRRVAIADRSVLAHNVYQMLLKPLGLSLFSFKTLKDLKENFNKRWNLNLLLINSNTFGHHFEKHMEWFLSENNIQKTPKFFLCESGEKKILSGLKKLPNSFVLAKPFYPSEFEKKVAHLFKAPPPVSGPNPTTCLAHGVGVSPRGRWWGKARSAGKTGGGEGVK